MSLREIDQILVIGIGNPLRGDDGVGPLIAEQIGKKHLPGVRVHIALQLDIELLEEAVAFSRIILVDASFLGEGLELRRVRPRGLALGAYSHHLSPELFWALADKIYQKDLNLYVCALRGRAFGMGEPLSGHARLMVPKALEEICAFLNEE